MYDFHCWADAQPERVAVVMGDSGTQFSAGELAEKSRNYAQWLAAQGIEPGDTIALLLENRIETLELALAARLTGAYVVVITTHLTVAEVSYIVRDCQAKMLFFSAKTKNLVSESSVESQYLIDANTDAPSLPSLVSAYFSSKPDPIDLSGRPVGRDLLYSSGTTGSPKGIKKALFSPEARKGAADPELLFWAGQLGFNENTVYLSPAPLYHAAPLRSCIRVLNMGGKIVIMERFDAEKSLSLMEKHKVSHSQWVPTMFQRLLCLPREVREKYDVSSQKYAVHAAAPCPVDVKQAMLDWWGDILIEYYAGSESCGATLITSKEWRKHPGSVGKAANGKIHIMSEEGQELAPNKTGKIYFSGVASFSYLNDPEKTKEAFNEKGWATYGDLGHLDEEGYLYLSDRRSDLIISGGVNLYPKEIEDALSVHPYIADVAVVGIPHADLGEQALAVVVPVPDITPDQNLASDIINQASRILSRVKIPRRLVFVDEIPKLETGKILRRKLKEKYKAEPFPGFDVKPAAALKNCPMGSEIKTP